MNISDKHKIGEKYPKVISDKVVEKITIHILFSQTFGENLAGFEIMW
jgi:hypothetical protein